MRLVWFSHFIPYPPRGGAFQRTYNLLRYAAGKYETTFVALNLQKESSSRLAEFLAESKKFCAEVQFWETPVRWRGVRWWAQLGLSPLYNLHYAARSLWSAQLKSQWQALLARHQGDLIHYETIDLAGYFQASEGFRRVLNHQNCESAMTRRRAGNERNPFKRAYLFNQAQKLLRAERQWCPQFDVNLAVSKLDGELLQSQSPEAHIHVVENGTDTSYFTPSEVSPEPWSLVFAGDLGWYPNVSGVLYFAREIWPSLKLQCPELRLYLAGRKPSPDVVQCVRNHPGMVLAPDPEDIRPWISRAAVYVCPILDGGGTRLKILDALAMSMPLVTTSIGCEGLRVQPGEHLLVADTPADFARETLRLLRDQALRGLLGTRGRSLVEEQYSWKVAGEQLMSAYKCALKEVNCPDPHP